MVWRRFARSYSGEEVAEDDPPMREAVRNEFIRRLRGRRVLEVGCGPGTDARKLADRGLSVTATDYAPEFIAIVQERHPQLAARVMDMTAPDLPPESFDGIYGFASFIHLPRSLADRTLAGLFGLLAPDGLLCLQLIRSTKGIEEYSVNLWGDEGGSLILFSCYDEQEIERRLHRAGFAEVEIVPLPNSDLYDNLPRLIERGIRSYLAFARRSG